MLQIKNLTITHIKDNRVLIEDISFTLNKGDKIVIIGEEGNGKSTLLKLIYDENPHGGQKTEMVYRKNNLIIKKNIV